MTQEEYSKMLAEARDQFKSGVPLFGREGAFHRVLEDFLNTALEGEMDGHLQETKPMTKNRRNGKMPKRVQTEYGPVEIEAPRDRDGSFTPEIVQKRQTVLAEGLADLKLVYQDYLSGIMRKSCHCIDRMEFLAYFCNAKKGRDGLCHQRTISPGWASNPARACQESDAQACPPAASWQVNNNTADTVQLTHPKKSVCLQWTCNALFPLMWLNEILI